MCVQLFFCRVAALLQMVADGTLQENEFPAAANFVTFDTRPASFMLASAVMSFMKVIMRKTSSVSRNELEKIESYNN